MLVSAIQMTSRLQPHLERVSKSSFVRNVLIVMSGTAIAQAVGFALSPVISRLFSPGDFGIFGSFNSVATIIAAGTTLEYTQAIMLPKEKVDAMNLFAVSCACTLGMGFLCLLFCLLAPVTVNGLMKTEGYWALALLVLASVTDGLNSSCQAWCVRVKAFKRTSAAEVVRSASSNSFQLGFGWLKGFGAAGLILSDVLANVLGSLTLSRLVLPDLKTLRSSIRWERMKELAKEYRDFPKYSATQNVVSALSSGLPVLLLTHYFGIVAAGAYAFAVRILWAPTSLLLRALRQVLFQKAGETLHQGRRLTPLYVKTSAGLFALAIFPCFALFIWSPPIFTWVFGERWHIAGEFARNLVPWLLFAFCNLPAVLFARLIRIQRTVFIYDLVMLAARILALVLGGLYLSASQSVLAFALVGAVMNGILILIVGHAVMKSEGAVDWNALRKSLS